jgi:hypothetical protein
MKYKTLKLLLLISLIGKNANAMEASRMPQRADTLPTPRFSTSSNNEMILKNITEVIEQLPSEINDPIIREIYNQTLAFQGASDSLTADLIVSIFNRHHQLFD